MRSAQLFCDMEFNFNEGEDSATQQCYKKIICNLFVASCSGPPIILLSFARKLHVCNPGNLVLKTALALGGPLCRWTDGSELFILSSNRPRSHKGKGAKRFDEFCGQVTFSAIPTREIPT